MATHEDDAFPEKKTVAETKTDAISAAENVSLETIRGQRALEIRRIQAREQEIQQSDGGRLLIEIRSAFKKDREKTSAQKGEDLINSNALLNLSRFIRQNAGTLVVIGTTLTIISATGGAPIVIGAIALGSSSLGALQIGSAKLARTSAMLPIVYDQNKRLHDEGVVKINEAELQKAISEVEARYNSQGKQATVKELNTNIENLKNEILRLEKRKEILKKIEAILSTTELKDIDEMQDSTVGDRYKFEQFIKNQSTILEELKTLIDESKKLDSAFAVKTQAYDTLDGFNELKKHLLDIREYTNTNIRNAAQIKSRTDILEQIKIIQSTLAPKNHAELLIEEAFSQATRSLTGTGADAHIDFATFKREKQNQAAFKKLDELIKIAGQLDPHFAQYNALRRTAGGSLDQTGRSSSGIASFNSLDSLQKYLTQLQNSIKDPEDTEEQELAQNTVESEITYLNKRLVSSVEQLETFTQENKAALEQEKVKYERELSTAKAEVREKQLGSYEKWKKELQMHWNTKGSALVPIALTVMKSGAATLDAMTLTASTTDTIPTTVPAAVTAAGTMYAAAQVKTSNANASLEGANTIVEAIKQAAAAGNATPQSIVAAAELAEATVQNMSTATMAGLSGGGLTSHQATGAALIVEAVKTAASERATADSLVATAVSAAAVLKEQAGELAKREASAKTEAQILQGQLSVSGLNTLQKVTLTGVNDVVKFLISDVLTPAEQALTRSAENDTLRLFDLLEIERVCCEDDNFKATPPAFTLGPDLLKTAATRVANAATELLTLDPKFNRLIGYLTCGNELKKTMLEIMKTNRDEEYRDKKNNTEKNGYKTDSIRPLTQSTTADTLTAIDSTLGTINAGLLTISKKLSNQLKELSVYFPPDDNSEKQRFMLLAGKDQVVFFKNILELKEKIISINKTLEAMTPEALNQVKANKKLQENFIKLIKNLKEAEKAMQMQLKENAALDQANENYRKPYVNVFKQGIIDPVKELPIRIQNANFADLLSILTDHHHNEFVKFAREPGRKVINTLAQEYCKLYAYDTDNTNDAERTLFSKKIAELLNRPDNDLAKQEALAALKELHKLHNSYLQHRGQPFNCKELKKIQGEEFESDAELVMYLQNNEQLYHVQRVMGIQTLGMIASMQKDLKSELTDKMTAYFNPELIPIAPKADTAEPPLSPSDTVTLTAIQTDSVVRFHEPEQPAKIHISSTEPAKTESIATPPSRGMFIQARELWRGTPKWNNVHQQLYDAMTKNDLPAFEELLVKELKKNSNLALNVAGQNGTLLHTASAGKLSAKFSELLLQHGADPNYVFNNLTPVELATMYGKVGVLENYTKADPDNKKRIPVTRKTWEAASGSLLKSQALNKEDTLDIKKEILDLIQAEVDKIDAKKLER